MTDNKDALYAAFKAKDARFDGRFFVGVSSTGIYCRPVCRAKQPKPENCTFYVTAASAEQAGYRPCLLCRPELAPGTSITDATANLVYRAARMLEESSGSGQSLEEIAGRLGCTDRHLRRVFTAEYQVSPIQYLQTCRLLLAKNLLTDTHLPVLEVAMAAGFGSLRRFNDLFKKQYKLSPTALRKRKAEDKKHTDNITLSLSYRPPYLWDEMLNFLAGRAIAGIEVVKNGEYMRTVQMVNVDRKPVHGWVRVGHDPKKYALSVTVSATLLPVLPQVLARIRHLFDLYCDPGAVYETLQGMNDIRPGLCVLGARVPGCFNAFEIAVRAVLGQQITVKAASTLATRIVQTYGVPIQTSIEGLTHIFPLPENILSLDGAIEDLFGVLGVTSARSNTIYELAQAFVQREIDFNLPTQPEEEMKKLIAIRGIGSWTAQYIAMRAMEWPDAFLETDAGVKKALQPYTSKELLKMAEAWRPWRSYATINLWNSLTL
ncbi:helix-turn-helix domain-containing protein [Paenibacillus sp. CGMCC 1.16610]|uniref:DNA-3-methyladenine glycosylase II n=1 Tax=Paenibacillus anseongense TaxID=2682845 RepID=A0ABW9U4A7_9BACL|nr:MULTISPECIES: AlkA N-terminal domain-containing protein [Paenibacillus]MBA2938962.1 helix-turn-helix domain-containing protein [Paenibacillus sp. CGMCC 1.16610]MVQ34924.1 helix-turn-helix domain-containing protein [Paenibacillus anseongense]